MDKTKKWAGVTIPVKVVKLLDEIIERSEEGYISRSDAITHLIREKHALLQRFKNEGRKTTGIPP